MRLRRLFPGEIETWIKEEGGNPTGSFKARGLSLAVNRAQELGAPGVQLPSAGQEGAKAIVLACTELEMVVDTDANVLPVFDSTDIHCRAAAEWMLADD